MNRWDNGFMNGRADMLVSMSQMTSSDGANKNKSKASGSSDPSKGSKDDKGKVVPSIVTTEPPPSDPKEAWAERVDIITKEEHEEYVQFAQEHVQNLISEVDKRSAVQACETVPLETGKLTVEQNQDTDVSEYESADDVSVTSPLTSPKPDRRYLPSSTSEEFVTVSSAPRSSEDQAVGNGQDTAPPSSTATPHRTATVSVSPEGTTDEVVVVDVETNRTVTFVDQNESFGWEGSLFAAGIPVSTPKHNLLDTSHLTDFVQITGGEHEPRRSGLFRVEGSPLIALSPVPQLKRPLFIAEEDEENDSPAELANLENQLLVQPSATKPELNVTGTVENGLNLTVPVIETPEPSPLNVTFDAASGEPTNVNKTFQSPTSSASCDATHVLTAIHEVGALSPLIAPLNRTFGANDIIDQTFDAKTAPLNDTSKAHANDTAEAENQVAPLNVTQIQCAPLNQTESQSTPLSQTEDRCAQLDQSENAAALLNQTEDQIVQLNQSGNQAAVFNQTDGQGLEFSLRVDDSYAVGFVSAQSFAVSRINSEDLEATQYADVEKSVVSEVPKFEPTVEGTETTVTVESVQAVSEVLKVKPTVEDTETAVTVESVQAVSQVSKFEPTVEDTETAVTVESVPAVSEVSKFEPTVEDTKTAVTVESVQTVSVEQILKDDITVSEDNTVGANENCDTVESGKDSVESGAETAVSQESGAESKLEAESTATELKVSASEAGKLQEESVCVSEEKVAQPEGSDGDSERVGVVSQPQLVVNTSEVEFEEAKPEPKVDPEAKEERVPEVRKPELKVDPKAKEESVLETVVPTAESEAVPSVAISVNPDDIPLAPPSIPADVDDIPIPKKGYDLSFLDKLEDAENAVPDFQPSSEIKPPSKSSKTLKPRSIRPPKEVNQEKVVSEGSTADVPTTEVVKEELTAKAASAPEGGAVAPDPKKEPVKRQIRKPPARFVRPKPVPKTSDEVEILLPKAAQEQVEDIPLPKPADQRKPSANDTSVSKPSVQDTPLPKLSVEDTPLPKPSVDDIALPKPSENFDEDIPIPKKGYNLAFLDNLEDLENASPTSLNLEPKVTKPAKVQPKKEVIETSAVDQPVPSEPPKAVTPLKPVEPQVQISVKVEKTVFEDLTEKQKLDRLVAQQEESLAPSEDEILAQEAASVCEEIANLSRHLEEDMAEIGSPNRNTVSDSNVNPVQSPLRKAELDTRTFKKPSARAPARKSVIPSDSKEDCFSDPFKSSSKLADDVITVTVNSDEMKRLQEATANEEFVSGSADMFSDPSDLDYLSKIEGRKRTIAKNSLYMKFDPIVSEALRAAPDGTENPPNPRASLFLSSPTKEGPMVQSAAPVTPMENVNSVEPHGDYISGKKHREITMKLELNYQEQVLQKTREIQELRKELEMQRLKVAKAQETEVQVQSIIQEYESVIGELTAKHETLRTESQHQIERLKEELAISLEDLRKTERAFNDTMQKYERTKSAMEVLQANEEILKNAVEQYNKQIELERQKMKLLKESFTEKCEQALANHKKELEAANLENTRLNALLKRSAMQTKQLEAQNEMLKKTNEELTSICDGLVAQMS